LFMLPSRASHISQLSTRRVCAPGFIPRLALLVALFAVELLALSTWLDSDALRSRTGLTGFVRHWGEWILRFLVAFGMAFLSFTYLRSKTAFRDISRDLSGAPAVSRFFLWHAATLLLTAGASAVLFGRTLPGNLSDALAGICLVAGGAAMVTGALSFIPSAAWMTLFGSSGWVGFYAALAGAGACLIGRVGWWLWTPAARSTFDLVRILLRPFSSSLVADPARMLVGTQKFSVTIDPPCSGFEGAGLMLAFGLVWLWLFRRECRFPQAFLLVPAGVTAVWLLNSVRLAALILIGDAGAPAVAMGGFHSQAGWIAFNGVALGLALGTRRLRWFTKTSSRPLREVNPAAAYLMPFLAITAAAMVSRAAAADFEWLYPLRLIAAAAFLWIYREAYRKLNWRFDAVGVLAGVAVFALWIAPRLAVASGTNSAAAAALTALPFAPRAIWLACRLLAAVVTAPIAEELAFRGFLIRRVIDMDFESLDPRRYTWVAVAVSSVAFGLLHGSRWASGVIAGLVYAAVFLRRGRIGDAVAAHSVTNLLLAVWVATTGQWDLW
jgi:exosortase E/protease (VPEID-CTERM system)